MNTDRAAHYAALRARVSDGEHLLVLNGIATRYNIVAMISGRLRSFQPGCFARSLAAKSISICADHDKRPLVSSATLHDNRERLRVAFPVRADRNGERILDLVSQRGWRQMSVGISPDYQARSIMVRGETVELITDAELVEISIVASGAVPGTNITFEPRKGLTTATAVARLRSAIADPRSTPSVVPKPAAAPSPTGKVAPPAAAVRPATAARQAATQPRLLTTGRPNGNGRTIGGRRSDRGVKSHQPRPP